MKRINLLLLLLSLLLVCVVPVTAQDTAHSVVGRWVWKEVARRNKPQKQFTLVIQREGNALRGIYSVDEFINGEWQGEDGNQTPFTGKVNGASVEIEFDPQATVPGYEENVVYAAPTDGRKSSLATVSRQGKKLTWRLVRGPGIEGLPRTVVLMKERTKRT